MDQNNSQEDNELLYIYEWVDSVPLSRPKKNIARDFSDGVLMAELIKNHLPKIVELHNYPSASSTSQKNYNWSTLNQKVFKKLGFQLKKNEIQDIISCKPGVIEELLSRVYKRVQMYTGNEDLTQIAGNNMSGDMLRDKTTNEKLNINNSNPFSDNVNMNYVNASDSQLRRLLEEKDLKIEELKNIIEILEMKLQNSHEIQSALEKRVKELTDTIREKGIK